MIRQEGPGVDGEGVGLGQPREAGHEVLAMALVPADTPLTARVVGPVDPPPGPPLFRAQSPSGMGLSALEHIPQDDQDYKG